MILRHYVNVLFFILLRWAAVISFLENHGGIMAAAGSSLASNTAAYRHVMLRWVIVNNQDHGN